MALLFKLSGLFPLGRELIFADSRHLLMDFMLIFQIAASLEFSQLSLGLPALYDGIRVLIFLDNLVALNPTVDFLVEEIVHISDSCHVFVQFYLSAIIQQFEQLISMNMISNQEANLRFPNGDTFTGALNQLGSNLQEGKYHYQNDDVYTGCFEFGMRTGYGTYIYAATGERYQGEWKNDMWDGKGTYSVGNPPEVVIKGSWERGVLNGQADVSHRNGDRFNGTFRNGKKIGKGRIHYQNGAYFEGNFLQDRPNGMGKMIYKNQNGLMTYEGEFKDGLKWGRGNMISHEGEYKGEWAQDDKCGRGRMTFANGDVYEGQWRNGVRFGEGSYNYFNGDAYKGSWVNDKKEGRGTLDMETGDSYTGDWKNGKKHGWGRYKFSNQDFYEGQFVEGLRFGKGKYMWIDGSFYDGEWKADKMNGRGVYRGVDGTITRGVFQDDNLVSPQ